MISFKNESQKRKEKTNGDAKRLPLKFSRQSSEGTTQFRQNHFNIDDIVIDWERNSESSQKRRSRHDHIL